MAREIMCLGRPDGTYRLLFFYQIATPIALPGWDGSVEQGGANVVPSPSSSLPEDVAGEFTTAEKAALDDGTWAFQVVEGFLDTLNVDGATFTSMVQVRYAAEKAAYLAEYADRYKNYGKRYDAV